MTKTKFVAVALGGLILTGCGHMELIGHTMSAREWGDPLVYDAAKAQNPVGSPFTAALAKGYLEFAANQKEEGDLRNFEVFARKALLAAQGVVVDPELPDRWDLDKINYAPRAVTVPYADAYEARTRLLNAFWKCTRLRAPEAAAKAQVSYDMWIEELEEGWEAAEINEAKADFLANVELVEKSCPPPAYPEAYVVYFDSGRADLKKSGKAIVAEVARIVKAAPKVGQIKLVHTIGWADTRGRADANQRLSERRAAVVRDGLIASGIPADALSTEARGETHLPIHTGDSTAEFRNRVDHVIIYVKPVPPIPFSPAPKE
ncbi:putative OmpA-like domain-containing protein [uncultured Gammaproteobacteria bacterium]